MLGSFVSVSLYVFGVMKSVLMLAVGYTVLHSDGSIKCVDTSVQDPCQ